MGEIFLGLFDLLMSADNPRQGADAVADVTAKIRVYANTATIFFIAVCGLFVGAFTVYIGARVAMAKDDAARQNAKNQLVFSIVGLVSIIVLVTLFQAVMPTLRGDQIQIIPGRGVPTGVANILQSEYQSIYNVVGTILSVLTICCVAFGMWIGWQMMKADDAGKLKNAKMQFLYAIIGVVAIVFLQVVTDAALRSLIRQGQSGVVNQLICNYLKITA